jgi:hypothetical protein
MKSAVRERIRRVMRTMFHARVGGYVRESHWSLFILERISCTDNVTNQSIKTILRNLQRSLEKNNIKTQYNI